MPRTPMPYASPDMSGLARSLRAQLAARTEQPGHVELLNMLARAVGYRNYQHWRIDAVPAPAVGVGDTTSPGAAVERAARCFDADGCLARWPARTATQTLCLWGVWARLLRGVTWQECAFNARLDALHGFGDRALVRRSLVSLGLVTRTGDGRDYRRVERPPPTDAAALIRRVAALSAGTAPPRRAAAPR